MSWVKDRTLFISIPFTWLLPEIADQARQTSIFWDKIVVGGPAVQLLPKFFDSMAWVTVGDYAEGVLQLFNPDATRTTVGCVRRCKWCAVPTLEPFFAERKDWPDRPVIIDNNLLAASSTHFDKVIERLVLWQRADFDQGLDARLLKRHHARQFKRIRKPMIRLALDDKAYENEWGVAYEKLRAAGIAKSNIRSYVLCGFDDNPDDAWARCRFVESMGVKPLPMWFHALDTMQHNVVTEPQIALGWTDFERRKIMQWSYHHKRAVAYNGETEMA